MGDGTLVDLMIWDGLRSTFDDLHMVQQAAKVARELGISREDQDAWALRSHERAAAAQDSGRFDDEIVPVGDVTADESVRRDTSSTGTISSSDRKSTRLNSSHVSISYAVFCLKKKT